MIEIGTISFSEALVYDECPYKRYLKYALKMEDEPNLYTHIGSFIHDAIEKDLKRTPDFSHAQEIVDKIKDFLKEYPKDSRGNLIDANKVCKQAVLIYFGFLDFLIKKFPDCSVYAAEYKLKEMLDDIDLKFAGYIDLVLIDSKGEYHIIDYKTTKNGWIQKFNYPSTKKLYQVSLYKHFFAKKNNIDPKKIHTYYLLFKREPSKNKPLYELVPMSSGPKKCQNAYDWLIKVAKAASKGNKVRKRLTCKFCMCQNKEEEIKEKESNLFNSPKLHLDILTEKSCPS